MSRSDDDLSRTSWVFAYGSLVDPNDIAAYVGRPPIEGRDWVRAHLNGYERNWFVGMDNIHVRADDKFYVSPDGTRFDGVVLSLGLAQAPDQQTNGVAFRVNAQQLFVLDKRERRYNRVDISSAGGMSADALDGAVIYTYLPRADAVERAVLAVTSGAAAVPRAYHHKVRAAFTVLGDNELAGFDASTEPPDAPLVDLEVIRPGSTRPAIG